MIKKRAAFFRAFLQKGNRNGSLTPSSIFLCRKMISTIDFAHAKCIVELGPGEGVITREIIKKMGHGVDVDWWCLGCLIHEMVTGFPPYHSDNRMELF